VAPFTRELPEQIGGRYRIDRILGEGGAGCVYHATHADLKRGVAIKVVRPGRETAHSVERMRREARAVAKLRGPHVVRLLDYGDDPALGRYIVMEYVEGSTLRAQLERGPFAPGRAVSLAIQACEALGEAHSHGIVHRDIKPANLMLGTAADGREILKVADFGIAKAESHSVSLTESATLLGSPKYMSPEQIREARNVDARSDLWSLGVVLYEMVSGRLPFEAFTASGLLARIAADPPTPLRERLPGVSRELESVIMACLEKDPARRIASAEALAERLRGLSSESLRLSEVPSADAPKPGSTTVEPISSDLSAKPERPARRRHAPPRRRMLGPLIVVASLGAFAAARYGVSSAPGISARPTAEKSTPHAPPVESVESAVAPLASASGSVAPPPSAPSASVVASSAPVVAKKPEPRPRAKGEPGSKTDPVTPTPAPSGAFVDFGPRK
jgi:serine/threonine-protein kinase